MFALFLLVLLGVSALAIDYAAWVLTDRQLQNVSDHAALAGASQFDERETQGNCGGTPVKCVSARAQAWKSLSNDLDLSLTPAAIAALAANNTGAAGQASGTYGGQSVTFKDKIWVATPPPAYAPYTSPGGRYALNYGIVFVRVDRNVSAFLSGAIGIKPSDRTGWSTAGALPTDFALETFCRNNIAPQNGVCDNSAGVTIDGQGGIRLLRGDIGSNESLTVTSNIGNGVVVQAGNVFLVNRSCANSTWRCPTSPPLGGISDGINGKNAFYMAPIPVPQFQSPISATTVSSSSCSGADSGHLCVPFKDQTATSPGAPGDWTCATSGSTNRCGLPMVTVGTPSSVSCVGQGGGSPALHYYPVGVASGASLIQGDTAHPQSNGNEYRNIDDDALVPDADTVIPTPANPTDYVYTNNINVTGAGGPQTSSFIVNLGQSGPRLTGSSTVRYVAFKTFAGVRNNVGNPVTLQVRLLPASGSTPIAVDPTVHTLTDVPTRFEFPASSIPVSQYNSLRLEFLFTSSGSTASASARGGGISWAEIEHPAAQPPVAPMIPPGYYKSIIVPDNACMLLDPTGEYSTMLPYQMPGIYRFGGSGSPNDRKIKVGDGSFLIGDGVTLVFDADWPASGSNQGIAIGANGALVLNTMRTTTNPVAPCTPTETETADLNQNTPYLSPLQYSGVCAAWGVDTTVSAGIRPGAGAWAYCTTAAAVTCLNRATDYDPVPGYRGITFFFTPSGWPPSNTGSRFEMGGGSGSQPGIQFRGVMYAPYDNVKITGGNGFNTVGQIFSWTAKFNGGSASIDLDYPYEASPAAPYLLEPTISH